MTSTNIHPVSENVRLAGHVLVPHAISRKAHIADSADWLLQSIEQIPTLFGRISYVASLWDPCNKRYQHHPLSQIIEPELVNAALARVHREIFVRWLGFSIRQQRGDLVRYLDFDGSADRQRLRTWYGSGLTSYLPPANAASHERKLFNDDLTLVVESLISNSDN